MLSPKEVSAEKSPSWSWSPTQQQESHISNKKSNLLRSSDIIWIDWLLVNPSSTSSCNYKRIQWNIMLEVWYVSVKPWIGYKKRGGFLPLLWSFRPPFAIVDKKNPPLPASQPTNLFFPPGKEVNVSRIARITPKKKEKENTKQKSNGNTQRVLWCGSGWTLRPMLKLKKLLKLPGRTEAP